jgi:predicted nucleic acid-binding protein
MSAQARPKIQVLSAARKPDDDKFLACALASGTQVITSGDKALLKASGYCGIEILRPRQFVEKYLR